MSINAPLKTRPQTSKPGLFTAHPAKVGETYWQHAGFALRFSARLFVAGAAALIHAMFPWMCETTASRQVRAMAAELERRHGTS